jgi:hypothetical protein
LHLRSHIDLCIFETLRELRIILFHTLTESAFQAIQMIRPESRPRLRALQVLLMIIHASDFVPECAALDLGVAQLREQFPNLAILHLTIHPTILPTLTQNVAEYFPLSHACISILWSTRCPLLQYGTRGSRFTLLIEFGPFTNAHWDESVIPVSESGGESPLAYL